MRLKWVGIALGLVAFGAGLVGQVAEQVQRLPDVDLSPYITPSRPTSTSRSRETVLLSFEELMAIQRVPSSLETTIAASVGLPTGTLGSGLANRQEYEIVGAFRTSKRPIHPPLSSPNDVYCIRVYPVVGITLYVQDYVPRPDRMTLNHADDYQPGQSQRGRMDRFVAIQREAGGSWELYHPEVFNWNALCA